MRSVFIQASDARQFARNGYLRKKILQPKQIAKAKELYEKYFPEGTKKFYSSTFIEDVSLKKEISDELTALFLPTLNELFENYKLLGAQFLIKNPGASAKMSYHQDWTVVDENEYRSLTIWVGLEHLNEENGTLKIVPRSHEFSRTLRGPGNFNRLENIQNLLENKATTLILEPGEAILFDHSLVHGSGINQSAAPRIAIALGLVHNNADLVFYHKSDSNHFEKFKVRDDFFLTFPNRDLAPENATFIESLEQTFEKVKAEEFIQMMEKNSNTSTIQTEIQPLFLDETLQKRFNEDGYVKINLLNQEEVKDLKGYYQSLQHDHIGEYGFHISLENKNAGYVNGVFEKLFKTLIPKLNPYLQEFKAFTASFVIKEAGLQNIVPPHQDWSFVDEEQFCSATVWIPLMDVNKNNGALGLIKGSHNQFNLPRPSPSPQAKSILSDHAFTLFPFIEIIEMKAGELLIFNNKTIHASPPNISGKTRIAAGIGITQKSATLLHYYQTPEKEPNIEVYEVNESFFPKFNNSVLSAIYDKGEKPHGLKRISSSAKKTMQYSKQEITEMLCSNPNVKMNEALMRELADFYNYNMDGTKKEMLTNNYTTMDKSNQTQGKTNENNLSPDSKETAQNAIQNNVDNRTFFQKYTPANILAEIKYRLKKK